MQSYVGESWTHAIIASGSARRRLIKLYVIYFKFE